ncbi:MAG: alpha/beta fold hydrolase [Limosilactobacillus sp.]|uniref:alpha/beta fold hydrolase n=1 Tax=Limosilactobacillus sp. TaxID=2773925 RepID=UPI003F03DC30
MGTVIVLPDLKQSSAFWQQLKVGHHQLRLIDYRQFSDAALDYQSLAQAVEQLVRQVPQPVTLIGDGIGAVIALKVAVTAFGRIDNLLLIKPQYQIPTARLKRQAARWRLLPQGSFKDRPLDKKSSLALLQSLYDADLTNQLMHIQCPTTVFCGARDRQNRTAAQGLSNRLFDGHLIWIDRMEAAINDDGLKALGNQLR